METTLEVDLLPEPKSPCDDLTDLIPGRKVLFAGRIARRLDLFDSSDQRVQLNDFRMGMQQLDRKLSRDIVRKWRDLGIHYSFGHDCSSPVGKLRGRKTESNGLGGPTYKWLGVREIGMQREIETRPWSFRPTVTQASGLTINPKIGDATPVVLRCKRWADGIRT